VRALRFRAQDIVRRNQALVETAAEIAQMRVERIQRAPDDGFGLSGRDQRPERACGFEAGIEPGSGDVESGRLALGARSTPERFLPPAGIDRPLNGCSGSVYSST
jgi:hypothetical protein